MTTETDKTHTDKGKWSEAGVPHKGWRCVGTKDLGRLAETCEMCEIRKIRNAHYMEHPDYPEILRVGCVCAGNMEENKKNAKCREKKLLSLSRRKRAWATTKKWKTSKTGNPQTNVDGFRITIFKQYSYYKILIYNEKIGERQSGNKKQFGKLKYKTLEEAKAAAVEALEWAKGNLR